jgi:hypothetical protein
MLIIFFPKKNQNFYFFACDSRVRLIFLSPGFCVFYFLATESESSRNFLSESGSFVKKYFMDQEKQLKNHLAITVTKGVAEFFLR